MPHPHPERIPYYKSLHKQIAKETGLSLHKVTHLRWLIYHHQLDRRGCAEHVVLIMRRPKDKRKNAVDYYQKLLNFIASCSKEQWDCVRQLDKYHSNDE